MRRLAGWIGLVSGVTAISAAAVARWEWAAALGVVALAGGFVAWRWEPRE
jgi:hypothetical protein